MLFALHQLDGDAIVGGLFDDVAKRFEHRGEKRQPSGIGVKDQNSKLVHRIRLLECVCVR